MSNYINPKNHFLDFRELLLLLTRNRQLTLEMAKREISERYMGQILGTFWAIGHPLFIMAVFVFIFAYVFKMKIGGNLPSQLDYTTYLLSGLIPWMCFQESMSKGVTVILVNANLVKQVVFPIEILPVKGVLASLVTMLLMMAILVIYVLVTHHYLPFSYALLPVLIFFQFLAMAGVCFIFSSVGTYFRDLKDVIQVFNFAGIYMIPIFYLPAQVPGKLKLLLYANPFSYMIWCYQDVLYFGRVEHRWAWVVFISSSVVIFYAGYRIFRKLKIMFGNVL
ncbi:MAG: ABC transporter permease [Nitrospirae bacterium]|nr:ABC transporter permease [Nitrospirota bacterium]